MVGAKGTGKSKGFAFVEFAEHKDAVACLDKLNNNSQIFTDAKVNGNGLLLHGEGVG